MKYPYIKPLVVALLLGMSTLTISSAFAVKGESTSKGDSGLKSINGKHGTDGKDMNDCAPYHWGDVGPDGGTVAYVDGSGCHGLEVKTVATWAPDLQTAVTAAAANNSPTSPITGPSGLACSTTWFPSVNHPPATPNCWHLPTLPELWQLAAQPDITGVAQLAAYWHMNLTTHPIDFAFTERVQAAKLLCDNQYTQSTALREASCYDMTTFSPNDICPAQQRVIYRQHTNCINDVNALTSDHQQPNTLTVRAF